MHLPVTLNGRLTLIEPCELFARQEKLPTIAAATSKLILAPADFALRCRINLDSTNCLRSNLTATGNCSLTEAIG